MQTKTITYQKPGTEDGDGEESNEQALTVIVAEATALVGMKRTRLRRVAGEAEGEDIDQRILHYLLYPDLIAAVVESEGFDFPPDFEAFCQLPDKFVGEWEEAVYGLNPHWIPQPAEDNDSPKELDPNPPGSTDS